MQTLVTFVFKFLAALPLVWLHKLGNLLGSLGFRLLSKDRRRVFENMKLAGLNPTDEAVKKFSVKQQRRLGIAGGVFQTT